MRSPLPSALIRAVAAALVAGAAGAHALSPGGDGLRVYFAATAAADIAYAATIDPSGRLTLAGMAQADARSALARIDAAGFPDSGFGVGGLVTSTMGSIGVSGLRALAVMPDGRLVACGVTMRSGSATDFLVVRFLADGSPDLSFGGSGHVATAFAGTVGAALSDRCLAVAVQSDGRIVAAGATAQNGGVNNVALLRYLPDGQLDPAFGSAGRVIVNAAAVGSSTDNEARAVALQPDGRIVVAGVAFGSGANPDLLVMRFDADGTPDATFGSAGRVLTDAGLDDAANALALQADGRIVVAGHARTASSGNRDFVVARYAANGALDASFGSGGVRTFDMGPADDVAQGLAVMPWGRIVVAGSSRISTSGTGLALAVAALDPDGAFDRYFGDAGRRTLSLGIATSVGYAVVADFVHPRLWVVGTGDPAPSREDLMAVEFGLPDTLLRDGFEFETN